MSRRKTKQVPKDDKFSIEHYPITKRYYPKYKGSYLQLSKSTGITTLIEPFLFAYADHGETVEEAKKIIELYKEQWNKVGVVNIPLD